MVVSDGQPDHHGPDPLSTVFGGLETPAPAFTRTRLRQRDDPDPRMDPDLRGTRRHRSAGRLRARGQGSKRCRCGGLGNDVLIDVVENSRDSRALASLFDEGAARGIDDGKERAQPCPPAARRRDSSARTRPSARWHAQKNCGQRPASCRISEAQAGPYADLRPTFRGRRGGSDAAQPRRRLLSQRLGDHCDAWTVPGLIGACSDSSRWLTVRSGAGTSARAPRRGRRWRGDAARADR
jgi:hypothetical protein